ncbi:nucleotidyltransferase domain-containing protein [Acidovorax delafieldii]|jgi:hypothetical protein|uniref:GSU2403 family nucleotidyltransferase fold protein n=1 Tax=Acidovorax delafieldii TaxID=47920 RepID=UPI003ECFDDC8
MNDLEAFAKLVQALDPWRGQMIFIGGWGHRLHTLHPDAQKLAFEPVFTRDTDLAFANRAPLEGDIKAALAAHGFNEEFSGTSKPPAAHYTLGNEENGFYAEFLTPLMEPPRKRNGEPNATAAVAGISAHKIAHLGVLLEDPWIVTVGPDVGVPIDQPVDLQVANPLCFMIQKFLILKDRTKNKRQQDLLYVHDTLMLFGHLLPQLKQTWGSIVKPRLHPREVNTVEREIQLAFSEVTADILAATKIPIDRDLDPDDFLATCQYSFQTILES